MYIAKRKDGTFEILVNDLPYHVIEGDTRWGDLVKNYANLRPGWAEVDGEIVEDHRNTFGYIDGIRTEITEFGPLPEGFTTIMPIAMAKENALKKLHDKRKAVEYGGFQLDNQTWGSSEKDEQRLQSMAKVFSAGETEYPGWKLPNGEYITLTQELLDRATVALMKHYSKCFTVEAAKIKEVNACQTTAEVDAWTKQHLNEGW